MKITKKTIMNEILEEKPEAADLLVKAGMHCVGCPMAMQESLEEGCIAHGIEKEEIENLVKELNKK